MQQEMDLITLRKVVSTAKMAFQVCRARTDSLGEVEAIGSSFQEKS
jgi:hypothetical protein